MPILHLSGSRGRKREPLSWSYIGRESVYTDIKNHLNSLSSANMYLKIELLTAGVADDRVPERKKSPPKVALTTLKNTRLSSVSDTEAKEQTRKWLQHTMYLASVSYIVRATSLYAWKSYGTAWRLGQSCLACPKNIPFLMPTCLEKE